VGNRTAETGSGGSTTYASNNSNQYTTVSSVSSVAYSGRGDLTQFGDWAYSYDAQGNLIRANNTSVSSQYWRDAFGHRAVKDVNGSKTMFFNIGTTQLEAYDVTEAIASSTIYEPGIDRPLAEVSSGGTITFYHQDWLGSVVLLTSASGAKLQSFTYDVWGKPSGFDASGTSLPVSAFSSRFLYTAREYDPETELYHYRARAYSPVIGRFLQTDPIDFGGGDINMLRYAGNNPVNVVDPLGLWGINDCWTTPFPPYDPLNIPPTKPPGTTPPLPPKPPQISNHHKNGGGGGGGGGLFMEMDLTPLFVISDFFAGVGDALTLGLTNQMREAGGYNDVVDHGSAAYGSGAATGTGLGVATAGAGVAASAAGIAASVTAATQATELAGTYIIAAGYVGGQAGGQAALQNPKVLSEGMAGSAAFFDPNPPTGGDSVGTQLGSAAGSLLRPPIFGY